QPDLLGDRLAGAGDVPRFEVESVEHVGNLRGRRRIVEISPLGVGGACLVELGDRGAALRAGWVDPDFHQLTSISVAPVRAISSSKVVLNTAAGWPAAAHSTGWARSAESIQVGTGAGWPKGETPPMTWPVWRLTKSGLARFKGPVN